MYWFSQLEQAMNEDFPRELLAAPPTAFSSKSTKEVTDSWRLSALLSLVRWQ